MNRVEVCMLQEPYVVDGCVRRLASGMRTFVSENGKATVVVCSDSIEYLELQGMTGVRDACGLKERLVRCMWSPCTMCGVTVLNPTCMNSFFRETARV